MFQLRGQAAGMYFVTGGELKYWKSALQDPTRRADECLGPNQDECLGGRPDVDGKTPRREGPPTAVERCRATR